MPIKLLIVEDNKIKQENLKLCMNTNTSIQFKIIDNFKDLELELNLNNFTHLVSQSVVKNQSILAFNHLIKLPLLVVNDAGLDLSETYNNYTKSPLGYSNIFDFLSQSTPISYTIMEEYAEGDEAFFEQLKGFVVEEFNLNFKEIPKFIETKNLLEIKSRAHQMSSKFSMLDLPLSWKLCKEIDNNILNDTEQQIKNMNYLLVDIEIVLSHLQ